MCVYFIVLGLRANTMIFTVWLTLSQLQPLGALSGWFPRPLDMSPTCRFLFFFFLSTSCPTLQRVPGSPRSSAAPGLESAISLGSLHSCPWRMVLRNQDVSAGCARWYQALAVTEPGNNRTGGTGKSRAQTYLRGRCVPPSAGMPSFILRSPVLIRPSGMGLAVLPSFPVRMQLSSPAE